MEWTRIQTRERRRQRGMKKERRKKHRQEQEWLNENTEGTEMGDTAIPENLLA